MLLPVALLCANIIYLLRKLGGKRLSLTHRILYRIGVFPTRDYYFKPPEMPSYLEKNKS